VVGFEIRNEPGWGSASDIDAWRRDVLTPFHERLAKHLQGLAPDVLVFYDATGVDAVVADPQRDRPEGEGLVFAPHLYDFGLLSGGGFGGLQPEPPIENLSKWRDKEKTPVLLGEFGVGGEPSEAGADWLDRLMDAVDADRHSATLWEYSVSSELWNGEDLSVVDAAGKERSVLDAYVRPWLRAVAGTGSTFTWDREAGRATAKWTSDGGVTELVVPARLFPEGPQGLEVKGDSACHTFDPERGELRIVAPDGVEVEVTFTK
jgi:endoglycosylceramidase